MFVVRVRLERDGVAARVCVVRGEIVFEVEDEVVGLCGGVRGGRLHLAEVEQRVIDSRGARRARVEVRLCENFVLARLGLVLACLGDRLLARRRLGVSRSVFVVSRVRRAAEGFGGRGLYQLVVRGEVCEVSRVFVARVFGLLVA